MVAHRSIGPHGAQRAPALTLPWARLYQGQGGLVTTDYDPIAEQYKRAKLPPTRAERS